MCEDWMVITYLYWIAGEKEKPGLLKLLARLQSKVMECRSGNKIFLEVNFGYFQRRREVWKSPSM